MVADPPSLAGMAWTRRRWSSATWGGMIRDGFEDILDSDRQAISPGIAILVVFALNLLGDGLRDAVDPKPRSTA